jgi:ATP-dependent DNA helicase RecG
VKPISTAEAAILERMGIQDRWRVALLLPSSYEDITLPAAKVTELHESHPRPIALTVDGTVSTSGSRGVPRAVFAVYDDAGGRYRATIFGNARQWEQRLKSGDRQTYLAVAKTFGGQLHVTIKEAVEGAYVGRVRPNYPARRSRTPPALVRALVTALLPEAIPHAAKFVREQLQAVAPIEKILADVGCPGWTLEDLIAQAHAPHDMAYAAHANAAYQCLAALGALARMHASRAPVSATPLHLHTIDQRIAQLPFALTADQRLAVDDIVKRLALSEALRHVVAGECGSGKTSVGSVIAAAVVDASPGARVLVMVPNAPLAAQFRDDFATSFKDIPTALVTADADPCITGAKVVFGTSAVLHRDLGQFALVEVDEQQNWSRAQREQYVARDTHLIELSATCIPRTQALVRFGRVSVSQMRTPHTAKNIRTRLWEGTQGATALMQQIAQVIAASQPVLVVYPKREATGSEAIPDRYSIEMAIPRWERAFPGRVRAITSDDDPAAKRAAIGDLEQGRASVLLATTVVQVGLNIAGLRHIVIAHPERHGLTGLHQLRGRVARQGGDGFCELLALETMSEKARARIEALLSTTDGFALAEKDLQLRGTGDLGEDAETQSGADQTFLYGVPLGPDRIAAVAGLWTTYSATKEAGC